jgi:superfamily I DNA/RNA helicase
MNDTWWVKHEQLDEKQKAVIDLPLDESHLIIGPPGCGKTNLLLLRTRQLVLSNKQNVLIIVFTRTLREFLATGGHIYKVTEEKLKTLSGWSFEFLRQYGVNPAEDSNFDKQRAKRLSQIKAVIRENKISREYDAVILDEAQDYLPGEIDVFLELGEVVFAAADSRQRIYTTEHAADKLDSQFKNRYPLRYHYRNGHKICMVADELAKSWKGLDPLLPTSQYSEQQYPSSVAVHECANLGEQVSKAAEALVTQLKAYPDEYLGVICSHRSTLKDVWRVLQSTPVGARAVLQSAEDGYVPFDPDKPICVCSIHGAKGLEFRTVHLLDAESMKKSPLNRNIAYTAVTRAKTSLSIYHAAPIPPYFDSALNVIRPPAPHVGVEQLF